MDRTSGERADQADLAWLLVTHSFDHGRVRLLCRLLPALARMLRGRKIGAILHRKPCQWPVFDSMREQDASMTPVRICVGAGRGYTVSNHLLRALTSIGRISMEDSDAILAARDAFGPGVDFAAALHLPGKDRARRDLSGPVTRLSGAA